MTNTFINKVDAERSVLKLVNRWTPGPQQLAGLTATAINDWQRRLGADALDEVSSELKAVGDICQRLSDRSHETFEPLNPVLDDAINEGLQRLRAALDRVFARNSASP